MLKKLGQILTWGVGITVAISVMSFAVIFFALISRVIDEESLEVSKGDHAVAVVDIDGEILLAEDFEKALNKQISDDQIKAVVVRINTPGGAVGTSEEMYRSIKKADQVKPVVCHLSNIAASGGLYAAMGCRKIVTNQGTLTGSIGVILMLPKFSTLLDKVGFDMRVIKSGRYKDSGSPFRDLAEDEQKQLQLLVDETYGQFVNVIAEARNLEVEKVKAFADGRLITGAASVELGLTDQVGGVHDAARLALLETGDKAEPKLFYPKEELRFIEMFEEISNRFIRPFTGKIDRPVLLYQAFL